MRNVGNTDRALRVFASSLLILLALLNVIGPWGWIGLLPIATGLLRTARCERVVHADCSGCDDTCVHAEVLVKITHDVAQHRPVGGDDTRGRCHLARGHHATRARTEELDPGLVRRRAASPDRRATRIREFLEILRGGLAAR